VSKSRETADSVFLNVPYDRQFKKLFLAYISAISAFGFIPRATLEIPTSERRLDRILRLIEECRYSIHDLSRVQLDQNRPRTPRFNMPFELGLVVGRETPLASKRHHWFVFESRRFRLAKSLSDLNGTDPFIHNGQVAGVFREICNLFRRPGRQPSIQQMAEILRELQKGLPKILYEAGATSPYEPRVFRDICVAASGAKDRIV
jgi:hypothetical protein